MSYFYNGSSDLLEKLTSKISKPCLALMKNLSSSPQEFEIIDSNDCKQCFYSSVDWSCIPPLSESLILEFSKIEIESA